LNSDADQALLGSETLYEHSAGAVDDDDILAVPLEDDLSRLVPFLKVV
jgi:hypothetical protein